MQLHAPVDPCNRLSLWRFPCLLIIRAALVGVVLCGTAIGQTGTKGQSGYIEGRFLDAISELPKLAWALPDGTVAAQDDAPKITIYSWAPVVKIVHRRTSISSDRVRDFTRKHHVDCDALNEEGRAGLSLYDSSLKSSDGNPQMLYTREPLPGAMAGFRYLPLTETAAGEVWKRMRPESLKQPRRSFVIDREGTPYYYSFASLYKGTQGEMSRCGLFLHSSDGHIIAFKIIDVNESELCDGWTMPTLGDPLEWHYKVVNMLTAPQFPYPVLIMDTSTVEGRATSLVTFSETGDYSDFQLYKYVVNCY